MLDYTKSFIEEQFPVSKVSKESYKERKAGSDQTLTCLGKWWGRKPLVLVRSTILGCLLPVSDDKKKDRLVFQELMGMNPHQLLERKNKPIPTRSELTYEEMSYDQKLTYCLRPEQAGDKLINWDMVNKHLKTNAHTTSELIEELSQKRFGHKATIGDSFSGGGSIPFEAARMGCNAYGSDLNPLAGLLSWADIHIVGASEEKSTEYRAFLERVFDKTCKEIDALKVESNKEGQIAKYYLYCNEVVCPECGQRVPLLPTRVISDKYKTIVNLIPDKTNGYDFEVKMNSSAQDMKEAKDGTIVKGYVVCPHCKNKTSIETIRGGQGAPNLRRWSKSDWKPKQDDVLQERLYAIKAVKLRNEERREEFRKKPGPVTDATFGDSFYLSPTPSDLEREKKVEDYIEAHFDEWQEKGYIPSNEIISGVETDRISREKGWTYWHQLFSPRHLMFIGLLMKNIDEMAENNDERVAGICGINNTVNRFSKLSIWDKSCDKGALVFSNQALNTLNNWNVRSTYNGYELFAFNWQKYPFSTNTKITIKDARNIHDVCDIWITDPPYADAVNYDELSEYFLAWDSALIKKAFPQWYTDSKRSLAVRGTGATFNNPMAEIYHTLALNMPDNGMQVVMFTHQDVKVWAELSMVLWAAGLQVTSAWCIQTETDSGLKKGNYVQGTVLLVLRKRQEKGLVFQDELFQEIREEVRNMIDSMRAIDEKDNPDFNDNDYLLAAYGAALKVLTSYSEIDGVNVEYELTQARDAREESPVTRIINQAKTEAFNYLVPNGIDSLEWSRLAPSERFFIKAFEANMNGLNTIGTFQEFARSFGVNDYTEMMGDVRANNARIKTPMEFANKTTCPAFEETVTRQCLLAIYLAIKEDNALEGRNYLRSYYEKDNEYWDLRSKMCKILSFIARARGNENMAPWANTIDKAELLMNSIKNDML